MLQFLAWVGSCTLTTGIVYAIYTYATHKERDRSRKYRLLFLFSRCGELTPEEIVCILRPSLLGGHYSYELHDLEKAGQIKRRIAHSSRGRSRVPRLLYVITEAGRQALASPEARKALRCLRRHLG